ncbi:MAG TPA: hemolysin family protein [Acidimicrobiia bacterium]|nr:hemolysin family protein [Acidimicrobiia bacterium]
MAAVVVLIVANAFFVAGEFAIVAVERSRVERRAREGDRRAKRILNSLRNLSFELSGAQLGITVTSLILGAVAEPALAAVIEPFLSELGFLPETTTLAVAVGLAFILATVAQMVFGELVPKTLAISLPYRSAELFGIPMQMVNRALRPVILFLNNSADWTVRKLGIEPLAELTGVRSMEELELMIRSSGEEGTLDDEEMELLTRAITFTEKVAVEAMIPRVNVVAVNRHQPISELRQISRETGHSRFPVYGVDLDEIVGIVHVKDTLGITAAQRALTPVEEITEPGLRVPASSPLEQLLTGLQTEGRGMALVIDEYGGTAGIITVEDLLEEIFGEIEDEYDEVIEPSQSDRDVDVLSGLLSRHDVEERIGFEWPEGHFETLGGFLVATLGRFPTEGEVIPAGPVSFEVLKMDGHRVDEVRVIEKPVDEGRDGR